MPASRTRADRKAFIIPKAYSITPTNRTGPGRPFLGFHARKPALSAVEGSAAAGVISRMSLDHRIKIELARRKTTADPLPQESPQAASFSARLRSPEALFPARHSS